MESRADTPTFRGLELYGWRQFGDVRLEFHQRLTVLTGANATGKTTILQILNQHFGWQTQFVSTPRRKRRGGVLSYVTDWWRRGKEEPSQEGLAEIGVVEYSDGGRSQLSIPWDVGGSPSFNVQISAQHPVAGLFIPSHRPVSTYRQVGTIPTALPTREQLLETYLGELRAPFVGSPTGMSPGYRLKESLISLATFGYGNEAVDRNDEAVALYEGFQDALTEVLPESLGFRRLAVRTPEVVLETSTGDFSFDAVSGGIASIIDLTWQIYLRSQTHHAFVVLIDEPENHLHPELQRSLLPGFLDAFPGVQFIAATHNPFVVGSVPDSNVYVLRYNDVHRVESTILDTVNKAGTSNEILRDVLGLDFTLPIWAEQRLETIISKYLDEPIDEARLAALRSEMGELGLDHLFPDALGEVLRRGKQE